MIQIKNRWNGDVIYEAQVNTIKEAVKEALKNNADLCNANLCNADLCNTDLCNADLRYADLRYADLRNANLCNADLYYADLRYAKNITQLTLSRQSIVPEVGIFTAFKKIQDCLIELEVPKRAKRLNSVGSRKCRVSIAKVISITEIDTKKERKQVKGGYDSEFVYKVGRLAKPDKFDDDIFIECSHGIHCFITKEEAIKY